MEVSFRYCVCLFVPSSVEEEEKKVVVRRWETSLAPRKIGCHGKQKTPENREYRRISAEVTA